MGYGYSVPLRGFPPTCERIRHLIHVSGRAYELLAGSIAYALPSCQEGESNPPLISDSYILTHSRIILLPCSVVQLFLACKKWLAALPTI